MKQYKDYVEKVNEVLSEQGIGAGTFAYKNTNKEIMANSLIMLDLIKSFEDLKEKLTNKEESVNTMEPIEEPKSPKKTTKK